MALTYEIVLVTYHSHDQVRGFLEAIPHDQRVVVVDNASGADGVEALLADYPRARYLDGGDVGFARAANVGARSSDADVVVFANPDTRPTPAVFDALVRDLEETPSLGSVAAATVNAAGEIELGVGGWEPTVRRTFVYAFGLHRFFPRAGTCAVVKPGERVDLGWITGACLAVRRSVFTDVGGFDESFFVYNEDMAFGRSLRDARIGQRLRTDLLVPHATGGSGGGTKMPQQKGASMAQYLVTRNPPAKATLMRGMLIAGALARAAVTTVLRRRAATAHHLAYVRGLVTRRSPYASAAKAAQRPAQLRLVYRLYGGENRKGRPDYYDKRTCLASFLRAALRADASVTVLADGPIPADMRAVAERYGTVVDLEGGPVGMRGSFLAAVDAPRRFGWSDHDLVYLCEDDYLHQEEAFVRLREAGAALPQASYFGLYGSTPDHPAIPPGKSYLPPRDWKARPPATAGGVTWTNIPSTASTFGARAGALRADLGIIKQAMVPYPTRFLDHEMCVVYQGRFPYSLSEIFLGLEDTRFRTGWRALAANTVLAPFRAAYDLRALTRRRSPHLLYVADPNLASHIEEGVISPGVDWPAVAADAKAWWAAQGDLPARGA